MQTFKRIIVLAIFVLAFGIAASAQVTVAGSTGANGNYTTLKGAFDAINANATQTGNNINITITGNTTETATAELLAGNWTTMTIRPTVTATVTGSIVGAIIKLTGADNVLIDGRIGGVGTSRSLTVSNSNTSAATAAIWLTSTGVGAGATGNTIRNLEIACGATQDASTNTTVGILLASNNTAISVSSAGDDNDNNSFIANRIIRARYGIATRGQTTNNNQNITVSDNIIGPSAFGTDQIGKTGILMQADSGSTVTRNTVQFVGGCLVTLAQTCTTGADRVGIGIGSESWSASAPGTITSGDYTVTRNVIHDVVEERTFSAAGLLASTTRSGSATNNLFANNFIYNIRSNATTGDQVVGIGIAGGFSDRVVFNSISITGDMDPGTAATSATYGNAVRIANASGATHANLTLMDNSIYMDVNSNTATLPFFDITINSATYSFGTGGLNYNNYYFPAANPQMNTGGISTNGTAPTAGLTFNTLAQWKTALMPPQDANSIQADPQYVSNTADLHIAAASPNVNAGTTISGVNQDIDGQLRVGVPDIGADEPAGVTPPANDIAANALVFPTNGASVPSGTAFAPQASFINNGTATQTNVTVRFRVLDAMMSVVCNVTATIPSIDPNQIATVTFPNCTLPSGGTYTIQASSELVGDANTANDLISGTITAVAPLSGSVNVGTGQQFTSLTNAGGVFDALNAAGASGNVTVNITSDLSGENGTVALNELTGGFTVTIKPSGAARTISGSSTNSIIRLNGADNVTIDGSLTGGSGSGVGGTASIRNLTVQNTNTTATAGAVIAIMQGANIANNDTVKNVNVLGQDPAQTLVGIHVGGNTIGVSPTVASNTNIFIDNCSVQKAILGIFNNGVSAAIPGTGMVISHNDLSATGANRLKRGGIFFFAQNGIQVTENSIGGISTDESADGIGILAGIQNVTTTSTTSGGVYNANISRNRINGVAATSTTGFSAVGIAIAGDPLGANTISNNMISGINAPSTSPDLVAGIFVSGVASSNTKLYFNSVSITGDRGAVASQIGSYGIAISGTNPTVELKDNIFYNTQTSGGGAAAKSYSIGMQSTTFTNLNSNYNDFFAGGANAGFFRTGSLDTTGTDLANLAAWQTATSQDANSKEVDPLFVDPLTNLHIQAASPMIDAGTAVAGVTDDFDGQTRPAAVDIGADEIVPLVPGTLALSAATYMVNENVAGGTLTIPVNRTGGTDGAVSATYAFSGGTATGGGSCGGAVDYVNTGGTVSFANGETSKTFTVQICNDAVFEGNETFVATLSAPTGGATLGANNTATVTITDDEVAQPGTVQFAQAFYTVSEGAGTVTLTVTRTGGSDGAISVNYSFVGGTASGAATCAVGIDFAAVSGTLNWASGDSAPKTFNVTICEDTLVEGNENFFSALNAPTGGATVGAQSSTDVTITDNDAAGGLSGNVNVGTGQTYTSLTNTGGAFEALNTLGATGNVTFSITSDLTGETGTVPLNEVAGGFTVTVKPSGAARSVSGTSNTQLIKLSGADNVTIDGSTSGGTDRSLTISNAGTGPIVWIATNATSGANNDTIKNCILSGPGNFSGQGFIAGSGTTLGNAAEFPQSNNTIQNNAVSRTQNAAFISGNAANLDQNWLITGNTFGSATTADKLSFRGMLIGNAQNFIISQNTISGVSSSTTSTSTMSGIQVASNINGGTITRNQIKDIRQNNTAGWGSNGIQLGAATPTSNITVSNNFISDIASFGFNGVATTDNGYGIVASAGGGYKIYFNSVNMATNQTLAGSITSAVNITAGVTTAASIDLRDNILVDTETVGTRFAVINASTQGAAVFTDINYNDYFAQNVGRQGTTVHTTLAAWQGATGKDANSKAVDPLFVSATDLHLQAGSTLLDMGTPIAGITVDYDGDTRSATTPDIGADEVGGAAQPGTLALNASTYMVAENVAGGLLTITVNRTGGTDGAVSVNYALSGGTATGGGACGGSVDYVNTGGTVNFANGETSKTFTVQICDDAVFEGDETFNVTLSGATGGATIGSPATAVVTIVDNDPQPGAFSINDVRVVEGNSGMTTVTFTVTLTGGGGQAASVSYATANGTATAGSDYIAISPTVLSFMAGQTTQTVSVTIIGDTIKESNEFFFVNLSGASNATISDNQGVGIIIDDDRAYVADFDHDRKADYSVWRPDNGYWYVLQSFNTVPTARQFGASGDIIVPGDYDGDAIADLAVFRPSTGIWYIQQSSNFAFVARQFGASTDRTAQGDYDGDGKTDIAVFRPSTGQWFIFQSSTQSSIVVNFGTSGDISVQGDYDGDAKTDVAVYRPSSGTWYVIRSSNGSFFGVQFGAASDKPLVGDFDGDGRTDFTVFRSGTWFILQSLTGTSRAVQFGAATDTPVPADFDGDGSTDVAVWRPSSGTWYVIRSSDNSFTSAQFGQMNDVPVPSAYIDPR